MNHDTGLFSSMSSHLGGTCTGGLSGTLLFVFSCVLMFIFILLHECHAHVAFCM